jgi:mono/diheme cytochrome c family protein
LAQEAADRGQYLADAAQCVSCHTAEGGVAWAGGYAVETKFGTFYGPNLTSDPVAGLGDWTEDEFRRALRRGRGEHGRHLWPAFPWPSFTALTDADIADLWAYFQTIPPSPEVSPRSRARFPLFRGLLGIWRIFGAHEGPMAPDPEHDAAWNRGRYLGEAVVHCGECHTPRTGLGALRRGRELWGSDEPPTPSPDVTPGALDWSAGDLASFLEDGITPDGDVAGGEMRRVIRDGTAHLTEADREAIAAWATSVPASSERWRRKQASRD